jgi:hypothetical protein
MSIIGVDWMKYKGFGKVKGRWMGTLPFGHGIKITFWAKSPAISFGISSDHLAISSGHQNIKLLDHHRPEYWMDIEGGMPSHHSAKFCIIFKFWFVAHCNIG